MFNSTNNRPKVIRQRDQQVPPTPVDEPLPHLKRDDSHQADADKTNLPEPHRYNEPDAAAPPSDIHASCPPPARLPLRV